MSVGSLTSRLARVLPWLAVALPGLWAVRLLDDSDTWWHLASGRWILANGRVPDSDVLSYTVPTHDWVNLQWFYDVLLYGLYSAGGDSALILAAAGCFVAAFTILLATVRRQLGPTAAAAVVGVAAAVAGERFMIRPEMVSFVCLTAVLWICDTGREHPRRLWALPAIVLVWVNTHALFILGLVVVGLHLTAALVARSGLLPERMREASTWSDEALRTLALATAASLAASLANPYFVRGALFPLELLTRIDGSDSAFQVIGEFRRPFSGYFPTFAVGTYQVVLIGGGVLAALACLLDWRRGRRREPARMDLGTVLVALAFAYVSTLARRNLGVFALAAAPLAARTLIVLAEHAPEVLRRGSARLRPLGVGVLAVALLSVATAIVTNSWYAHRGETHSFGLGTMGVNFPIHAANFANENRLPGPFYNDLSAGGYLTWAALDGDGVYIDGRLEVYDNEFFRAYQASLGNARFFEREVERYGINSALIFHRWGNRHRLISYMMNSPTWALVYYDETAVVFVRKRVDDAAIDRSTEAFPAWKERTDARLSAPVRWWQWPVERYTALNSYAQLLGVFGAMDRSARAYERAISLGLPPMVEQTARRSAGLHRAQIGDYDEARTHLRRVLELDPDNRQVADMIVRIDGLAGAN